MALNLFEVALSLKDLLTTNWTISLYNTKTNPLISWLKLIRLPNQFSIPGDLFIGFFLATSALGLGGDYPEGNTVGAVPSLNYLFITLAISHFIYCAGMILNDVCDLEEDTALNRKRPLVNGDISVSAAQRVGFGLILVAIGLSTLINLYATALTLLLAALVLAYTFIARKWDWLGALTMGLCRGTNVLLGATFAGVGLLTNSVVATPLILAAMFHTVFIYSVSVIAANEMKESPTGLHKWAPALTAVLLNVILYGIYSAQINSVATISFGGTLLQKVTLLIRNHDIVLLSGFPFLALWSILMCKQFPNALDFNTGDPEKDKKAVIQATGKNIGSLIRLLIISQMAWIFTFVNHVNGPVALLICAYLLSGSFSKKFYAS